MSDRHWRDSLDPNLTKRLFRPLLQPGRSDLRLAQSVINRYQGLPNRLPLMTHLLQRQRPLAGFQTEPLPIVFAQPAFAQSTSVKSASAQPGFAQSPKPSINNPAAPDKPIINKPDLSTPSPNRSTGSAAVIQAKFANAASSLPQTNPPASSTAERPALPAVTPLPPEAPFPRSPEWHPASPSPAAAIPQANDSASIAATQPQPVVLPGDSTPDADLSQSRHRSTVAIPLPIVQSLEPDSYPELAWNHPAATAISNEPVPNPEPVWPRVQPLSPVNIADASKIVPLTRPVEPKATNSKPLPIAIPLAIQPEPQAQVAILDSVAAIAPPANPLAAVNASLPVVPMLMGISSPDQGGDRIGQTTPLVFSTPQTASRQNSQSPQSMPLLSNAAANRSDPRFTAPEALTAVSAVPIADAQMDAQSIVSPPMQTTASTTNGQSELDVDALAEKVERKLMRRLAVERERRGWKP